MDIKKNDGEMTPEELQEAIDQWKAKKEAKEKPVSETLEANDDAVPEVSTEVGKTPEEIAKAVRERKEQRAASDYPAEAKELLERQDEDIDMLLACVEKLLSELQTDGKEEVQEPVESKAAVQQSLNADSADELFRQRLSICRIGDKLNMDGLESKSILDGKKEIIKKVLPQMNMDGKSSAYIDAAYDLAVGEVSRKNDVEHQKAQMAARLDNKSARPNTSLAAAARARMIEGGNE